MGDTGYATPEIGETFRVAQLILDVFFPLDLLS